MKLLIVAGPCVCCCRCSRHYSTSAWHQCLFQFHLIALVIKLGADTTHHIIALITSELHCVHMTISLTQTLIPSLPLHPSLPVLPCSPFICRHRFDPVIHPSHTVVQCLYSNKLLLLCCDSFNDHFDLMQNYSFCSGGEVTNSDGVHCGFLTLCKKGEKSHHTSTISQSPEQGDMVLVGFFYHPSRIMMREDWPVTLIIEGSMCVCVVGVVVMVVMVCLSLPWGLSEMVITDTLSPV